VVRHRSEGLTLDRRLKKNPAYRFARRLVSGGSTACGSITIDRCLRMSRRKIAAARHPCPSVSASDLDGVLADLNSSLVREAMRLFPGLEIKAGVDQGVAPAPSKPEPAEGVDPAETSPASLSLTRRQERQLWDAVKRIDNFWETLDETEPGIIKRLAETARARRWEIMFSRAARARTGDVVQVQSQRWLRAHGFEYPALFVVSTSRGKIAAVSSSTSSSTIGRKTAWTSQSTPRRARF
jgi:hypothetical protein